MSSQRGFSTLPWHTTCRGDLRTRLRTGKVDNLHRVALLNALIHNLWKRPTTTAKRSFVAFMNLSTLTVFPNLRYWHVDRNHTHNFNDLRDDLRNACNRHPRLAVHRMRMRMNSSASTEIVCYDGRSTSSKAESTVMCNKRGPRTVTLYDDLVDAFHSRPQSE